MDRLLLDLRSAVRQLRKHISSTTLAVGTLALGIGSTAAVVSVVDTLILRELPYPDAERIVTIWQNNARDGIPRDDVSPGNYLDWKERQQSFEVMGAADPYSVDLTGDGPPEVLFAMRITDGFFETVQLKPIIGRLFRPEDYQQGAGAVVVLSYGVWQRRFGGDLGLVGRSITLDGNPTEVVGILPRTFELGILASVQEREAWIPLQFQGWEAQERASAWWNVIGRVSEGMTIDQARTDLQRVSAMLESEYPSTNRGVSTTVIPLHEHLVGSAGSALLILLGASLLVLLIGCANVANLLLARGADRESEFAVRTALGARPSRILRQLLTESLGLALVAGTLGIVLAFWGVDVIKALSPGDIPRMDQVVVDLRVLGIAIGITFVTALVFGFAPAMHFSRANVSDALRDSKGSAGRAQQRLRRGLIVAETALALSLLIGAGLLVRSFLTVLDVDPCRVRAGSWWLWGRRSPAEDHPPPLLRPRFGSCRAPTRIATTTRRRWEARRFPNLGKPFRSRDRPESGGLVPLYC